jgi:hypothetical protein
MSIWMDVNLRGKRSVVDVSKRCVEHGPLAVVHPYLFYGTPTGLVKVAAMQYFRHQPSRKVRWSRF